MLIIELLDKSKRKRSMRRYKDEMRADMWAVSMTGEDLEDRRQ